MDVIGMNPNSAGPNGEQIMTLSESFATLQGDMRATVDACITAAGDLPARDGYAVFGGTWTEALAQIAAHGESVGGTTLLTIDEAIQTDLANALAQSVRPSNPVDSFLNPLPSN